MNISDISSSNKPPTTGRPSTAVGKGQQVGLTRELRRIRELVGECEAAIRSGRTRRLPGNVAFLSDGRVLCRARSRGDSRYPYGRDGLNFWVTAAGHMYGNRGSYFLFLPSKENEEPRISFFAGCRRTGASEFASHSLLSIPFIGGGESQVIDRYTVIGQDATYYIAETPEVFTAVRVFLSQSSQEQVQLSFSVSVENLTSLRLETYTSTYMNPFCRHRIVETFEDRWFKKVFVERYSGQLAMSFQSTPGRGIELPPFVIETSECEDRLHFSSNLAMVRRNVCLRKSKSGDELPLSISGCKPKRSGKYNGETAARIESQVCTSRIGYTGSERRSLSNARFLETGEFEREVHLTVFNDNAIVGDLLKLDLPGESTFRADYVFSMPESREFLELDLLRHANPQDDIDTALECTRRELRKEDDLSISLHGKRWEHLDIDSFNNFVPFLKQQVALCARVTGHVAPMVNFLIGFRDVFQAIEGHLFAKPSEARAKILEAISYVLPNGQCPRQYSLPCNGTTSQADLREFVDQGAWAISTIHRYLAVTGDQSLLDEIVGYHQVAFQRENSLRPADVRDNVLEHLFRITDYLDRNRDPETGLVLSLYGDWNDALDGLGRSSDPNARFGTGVSVMASLQFYQNCAEMLEILDRHCPGRFEEQEERLHRLREELRSGLLRYALVSHNDQRRIVHGWGDQRKYFVGSFTDCDGLSRDGLTSNAFWVLSGMLDEEPSLREDILSAFERLDSPYGLKTFVPGFRPDVSGVGRIATLPLGAAENGAVYVHATTFAIAALFQMGEAKRAWEQIAKILPFAPHHENLSHSPFVMPNSYVVNPLLNLSGQSMNDWQTGSSNMLLKLLIRYVFGFRPMMSHLCIAPAGWMPFEQFEFAGMAQERPIRIVFNRDAVDQRRFRLNGEVVATTVFDDKTKVLMSVIPYELLSKDQVNQINITEPDSAK